MKARTKRKLAGVAYVAPALLFVLAFTVYPFVRTFRISLTDEVAARPRRSTSASTTSATPSTTTSSGGRSGSR